MCSQQARVPMLRVPMGDGKAMGTTLVRSGPEPSPKMVRSCGRGNYQERPSWEMERGGREVGRVDGTMCVGFTFLRFITRSPCGEMMACEMYSELLGARSEKPRATQIPCSFAAS